MVALPPLTRMRPHWRSHLAHHPDHPAYAADVYVVGGVRLCVGCTTTYPVFLAVALALFLTTPLAWSHAAAAGALLASAQGLSSAGLARTRLRKAGVKTALGAGLALFTYGVLVSPWPVPVQFVALAAMLGLAYLSALPRRRRMRRNAHAT